MLRFASKPDQIFTRLINESLDMALDFIDEEQIDEHWLDSWTFKLFGSRVDIIIYEIKKLRAAHNRPELLMPTDLHFRLLDKILEWFCIIYNDTTETQDLVTGDGHLIGKFNIDEIRSTFFWDCDYDTLGITSISEQTSELFSIIGMSPSAINIQKGIPADLSDLTLVKMEEDPEWAEAEMFFEVKSCSAPISNHPQDSTTPSSADLFF